MSDNRFRTFWRRLGAAVVDIIVFIPLSFLDEWVLSLQLATPTTATYLSASSSIYLLYSILMHGISGQTIGKMLTGVKVVDLAETPLTLGQAILRDSFGLLFQLAFLAFALIHLDWWIAFQRGDIAEIPRWYYILGFGALWMFLLEVVTMLTNQKRRAVHDFIAGSVVVRLHEQTMGHTE